MTLGRLIELLEQADLFFICKNGFDQCYSWRGDYAQLAFRPAHDVSVDSMLTVAQSAVGKSFYGYKGGNYKMTLETEVYVAQWGEYGGDSDEFTEDRLSAMLGDARQSTDTERLAQGFRDTVGKWLSAALDDKLVCQDMKDDINTFFELLEEVSPSVND